MKKWHITKADRIDTEERLYERKHNPDSAHSGHYFYNLYFLAVDKVFCHSSLEVWIMNKVILVGRLVKDPEVKTTQSQIAVCGFTIAVDRKSKSASGERQADFLSCVAWRQQAEFLGKYFQKGSRIGVIGNLQSRSYDDASGKKIYVTEVIVDEIEFVESKRQETPAPVSELYYEAKPPVQPSYHQPEMTDFYPTYDEGTVLPFDL